MRAAGGPFYKEISRYIIIYIGNPWSIGRSAKEGATLAGVGLGGMRRHRNAPLPICKVPHKSAIAHCKPGRLF